MASIEWSLGFILVRLQRNDNEVVLTSSQLSKNSSWENVRKSPVRGFWRERYSFPEEKWRTLAEFSYWLQETFHHLDDGVYALWAWRDSLRWVRRGEKKYQKVRPFEPFAKFEVSNGSIIFNKDHKIAIHSHKTYAVWLMLEEEEVEGEGVDLLPRPKEIKL